MAALKLKSGVSIPALGFGVWKIPAEAAAEAVYTAIKLGWRCVWGLELLLHLF